MLVPAKEEAARLRHFKEVEFKLTKHEYYREVLALDREDRKKLDLNLTMQESSEKDRNFVEDFNEPGFYDAEKHLRSGQATDGADEFTSNLGMNCPFGGNAEYEHQMSREVKRMDLQVKVERLRTSSQSIHRGKTTREIST